MNLNHALIDSLSHAAMDVLVPVVFASVSAFAMLLLKRLYAWLDAKWHLKIDEANQAKIDRIVQDAIRIGEEKILAIKKANPTAMLTAADKNQVALAHVLDATTLTEADARNAIQAMLPRLGLGAAATPAVGPSLPQVEATVSVTGPLVPGPESGR